MPSPIITLTTDFGMEDHFVGVMKGVILSIAPRSRIVDITHQIRAFDIAEAAFVLSEACRRFPEKTVHVVVVDPGVGSARRPVLAQGGGHTFIAPDNGVLSIVLAREKCTVRHITAEKYFLKPVSKTFHGRDVFAPVAAHVAAGVPASRMGPKIADALRSNFMEVHRVGKRTWAGRILKIDRFGNLITSLSAEEFAPMLERPFEIGVGLERVIRKVSSYEEAEFGEPVVIAGSAGLLEIVFRQDSAAKRLGCGTGAPVELTTS
jgi:hypothetical protein